MGNSNSHDNGTIVKKVKVKKTKSYSQSKKNFKSTSELRIVVIGPKGCGKSALILRGLNKKFDNRYEETLEDTYKKKLTLPSGTINIAVTDLGRVNDDVWQEKVKKADGLVLCCSLDDPVSFTDLLNIHSKVLKLRTKHCPMVVVGTKIDLPQKLPLETFHTHFSRLQLHTMETSAKLDQGCSEVFVNLGIFIKERLGISFGHSTAEHSGGSFSSTSSMQASNNSSQSSFQGTTSFQSRISHNSSDLTEVDDQVAKRWSGNLTDIIEKEIPEGRRSGQFPSENKIESCEHNKQNLSTSTTTSHSPSLSTSTNSKSASQQKEQECLDCIHDEYPKSNSPTTSLKTHSGSSLVALRNNMRAPSPFTPRKEEESEYILTNVSMTSHTSTNSSVPQSQSSRQLREKIVTVNPRPISEPINKAILDFIESTQIPNNAIHQQNEKPEEQESQDQLYFRSPTIRTVRPTASISSSAAQQTQEISISKHHPDLNSSMESRHSNELPIPLSSHTTPTEFPMLLTRHNTPAAGAQMIWGKPTNTMPSPNLINRSSEATRVESNASLMSIDSQNLLRLSSGNDQASKLTLTKEIIVRPSARSGSIMGGATQNTYGVPVKYLVNFSEVVVGKKLGSGAFGEVFLGLWRGTSVAVKVNKMKSLESKAEFLREATLMMSLKTHSHVVSLLGITLNPISLLAEYMDNGSLEKYLEANPEIKLTQKVKWMHQIAAGMYHLHRENVVHKDVAARNVLLNQALVAKISDFGLARTLDEQASLVSESDVGPIKWMARESILEGKFSTKSDVYSYGIVGLEIMTQKAPFPWMSSYEFLQKFQDLHITKMIMQSLSADTPPMLEALILTCCSENPDLRYDFQTVLSIFQKIENLFST